MPSTISGCVSPKDQQPILANPQVFFSPPARNGRDRRVDEERVVRLDSSTDTWRQTRQVWLGTHRSSVILEPVHGQFVGADQGYP